MSNSSEYQCFLFDFNGYILVNLEGVKLKLMMLQWDMQKMDTNEEIRKT